MSKMKQKNKKQLIGTIIFYVVSALLVFYIVVNVFIPDRVVNVTGFQLSVIPSGSMEPEIGVGDIIILTPVDQNHIEEGDIVAFYNYINMNGVWRYERIVHRVIDIETVGGEEHYITQGDANDSIDIIRPEGCTSTTCAVSLTSDKIIAQVPQIGQSQWALRIPYVGYVILFVQWLFRILFANPILLLLVVVNIGIIVALIVVLKKGKQDKIKAGLKEEETRIKADDVTDDNRHERNDDEEDGLA